MHPSTRRILAGLFFLSGFSSLVYQVVWTRLAFASFGIIAPVLSVVISVFMFGLAVGSWAGGRLVFTLVKKTGCSAIFFYGIAELLIGVGAFAVPISFATSERMLAGAGQVDSFNYLFYSAIALGISIFPWCLCMGTTFPLMMAYVRERDAKNADSFSFLYISNVFGAMIGTILTALVLVELLGFHHTLWVAAASNFLIALISAGLGITSPKPAITPVEEVVAAADTTTNHSSDRTITFILFTTGFLSMAMEVVWARGFAGVLKTQVYSFALILFTYLLATFLGSVIYRRHVRLQRRRSRGTIFFWMALSSLFPIYMIDPTVTVQNFWDSDFDRSSAILLLASICPLCGLLGYLTPSLIDEYSAGQPRRGGSAYAANVVGCILGPLVGCYLLLPHINVRYALILLGLPFALFWLLGSKPRSYFRRVGALVLYGSLFAIILFSSRDFEERSAQRGGPTIVRRDYIASVVAYGDKPSNKGLVVNGLGMTILSPITKFIPDLPLSMHRGPAKSILVICFGMGTSYRTALTWGIDTTAVELVPSVPKVFGFYHADADKYLSDPKGRIVIDDGRRYLSRCGRKFDVIVVDPPPPVQAAGSSLLFSSDFYTLAKEHLNLGGIVQMWYPCTDRLTDQAAIRSIYQSFPHVRIFGSVDGWGMHFLGSMDPIEAPSAEQLIAKFPPTAVADLTEWNPTTTATAMMATVLKREYTMSDVLNPDLSLQITDDRPMNEYYLLRQSRSNHGKY